MDALGDQLASTKLIGTAGKLLSQARDLLQEISVDASAAVTAQCREELAAANKVSRDRSSAQKVLDSLAGVDSSLREWAPTLATHLDGILANTYDAQMVNPKVRRFTTQQKSRWEHRKNAQAHSLMSLLTRLRGKHACPVPAIRRTLELKYYHTPEKIWRLQSFQREVMSDTWVTKVLASDSLRAWRPPASFEQNLDVELHVRDNLEWWLKIKHNRHKDGKLLRSDIKHTVTGEVFYTPASITAGIVPQELGSRWHPFAPPLQHTLTRD